MGESGCYLGELDISNFALIEKLSVRWSPGLCVVTGETGAGKSILIEALGAVLGQRAESEWVRSGTERAWVEAIFEGAEWPLEVREWLEDAGSALDSNGLVLARDIFPGRSVSRVNGRAVAAHDLGQLAGGLVDIHSQGDQVALASARRQLVVLDQYGALSVVREQVAEAVRSLRAVREELRDLEGQERHAEREAAFIRHELAEIDAAAVRPTEDEELAAQRRRLRNVQRLSSLTARLRAAVVGQDPQAGALPLLGDAATLVNEIRGVDPAFTSDDTRLVDAIDAVEELAQEVRRYEGSLQEDPGGLETVEERLLLLADLKRKYGGTLESVCAYREEAVRKLASIEHREERVVKLRALQEARLGEAARLAASLSGGREGAGRELERAVVTELADLGMAAVRFAVELRHREDPNGLPRGGTGGTVAFDETGIDQVEFLLSSNPGEPLRPLRRVASGGELARIMLALKTALAEADETPVLVFDELDQGVGGRVGHQVGEKLWCLARRHQVLCVTHLPQVAAFADAHYVVGKTVEGGRTLVHARRVEGADRVEELALMLAGPRGGDAAREGAKELLARAEEWKEVRPRGNS